MSLDELIWQIYNDTNFYNYVTLLPNGGLKQANLKMLFERAKQYETGSFKGLFNFINFIDKLHSSSGDLAAAKLIGENENVIRIMSIHKSKGLEFPVVFLSCTRKQFNLRDLNDSVILHEDFGFGPNYINSDLKVEYPTQAKEAIRLQAKVETLSEEMRVLYVALTRAREKLIITGLSKDLEKGHNEKQELIKMYKNKENTVSPILLKKFQSYLDWLELVYFNNIEKINEYMELKVIKKWELLKELKNTKEIEESENLVENLNKANNQIDEESIEKLKKILQWKYAFLESSNIPTKSSVTKIKEAVNEEQHVLYSEGTESEFAVARPKFFNEDETQVITGAQKGTLMHYCFQKLDEKQDYSKEKLQEMINNFVDKKLITKPEADAINTYKLLQYTKSNLFKELKNAKEVHKEEPFYININSNEVFETEAKENILVQGIIDLYYINQNNEVILVDYKTDYVEKGKEEVLIEKYKKQLELYKRALEESLNRKVNKCYIYSVYLEKEIEIK